MRPLRLLLCIVLLVLVEVAALALAASVLARHLSGTRLLVGIGPALVGGVVLWKTLALYRSAVRAIEAGGDDDDG